MKYNFCHSFYDFVQKSLIIFNVNPKKETIVSLTKGSQKQPSICVLIKRWSENMQQIYRGTPMSKSDFNKFTKQLSWNQTSAWVFSCKFTAYFQNTFPSEHLWRAASGFGTSSKKDTIYMTYVGKTSFSKC